MSKIWACYVVFNEEQNIARSMRSVQAYVDGFIIIDTCFPSNPVDATNSTDNTMVEAGNACGNKELIYIAESKRMCEQEARNRYMEEVPPF